MRLEGLKRQKAAMQEMEVCFQKPMECVRSNFRLTIGAGKEFGTARTCDACA